jgi:hypothetical protein
MNLRLDESGLADSGIAFTSTIPQQEKNSRKRFVNCAKAFPADRREISLCELCPRRPDHGAFDR